MFAGSKKIFSINVFGQDVDVYVGNTQQVPYAGCYVPDEGWIWIRKSSLKDMQETLIHEILEVVWDRCSLAQTALDERAKDILIDVFSKAVRELIIDKAIHKKLK